MTGTSNNSFENALPLGWLSAPLNFAVEVTEIRVGMQNGSRLTIRPFHSKNAPFISFCVCTASGVEPFQSAFEFAEVVDFFFGQLRIFRQWAFGCWGRSGVHASNY